MDASIDPEDLVEMKYAELRKVAKSVGIKANQKVDYFVFSLSQSLCVHVFAYLILRKPLVCKPPGPEMHLRSDADINGT